MASDSESPEHEPVQIVECEECGGDIDSTQPGHYKSPDERFVHSVCFEEGEPSKVLDLYEEHPFKEQTMVQYGCGHFAEGPPLHLPEHCPECEVPAP